MDKVLSNLRKGMTIKEACRHAGFSTHQVYLRRKKDPTYSTAFEAARNPKLKPTPDMHITLRTKKLKPTKETDAYWQAWDDAAIAGTLVERYPPLVLGFKRIPEIRLPPNNDHLFIPKPPKPKTRRRT